LPLIGTRLLAQTNNFSTYSFVRDSTFRHAEAEGEEEGTNCEMQIGSKKGDGLKLSFFSKLNDLILYSIGIKFKLIY